MPKKTTKLVFFCPNMDQSCFKVLRILQKYETNVENNIKLFNYFTWIFKEEKKEVNEYMAEESSQRGNYDIGYVLCQHNFL